MEFLFAGNYYLGFVQPNNATNDLNLRFKKLMLLLSLALLSNLLMKNSMNLLVHFPFFVFSR